MDIQLIVKILSILGLWFISGTFVHIFKRLDKIEKKIFKNKNEDNLTEKDIKFLKLIKLIKKDDSLIFDDESGVYKITKIDDLNE